MQLKKIAIVGATGMVGRMFIKVLEERGIRGDYTLFASGKSAGSRIPFFGEMQQVHELSESSAEEEFDYALFSAGGGVSERYAPLFGRNGTVVIDNSSRWRMDTSVPLVVPEVNPEDAFGHCGIIANPNCSTIEALVAIAPIHRRYGIKKIVYTTFQAVSGAGRPGTEELEKQIRCHVVGEEYSCSKFPHIIFGNCIPQIDSFRSDGFTGEEHKMMDETRKILHSADIAISATCVRVPVLNGHSESIYLELEKDFRIEDIRAELSRAPGVHLRDDPASLCYPLASDACGSDLVQVGRLRKDPAAENGLSIWVTADNIRKGAATNAVQILELLNERRSHGKTGF